MDQPTFEESRPRAALRKAFDDGLRQLALSHAGEPLAHCKDIVTTLWGDWKNEHEVMIYKIGVEIVALTGRRSRRTAESIEDYEREVPRMGVEHFYYALRLNKDGMPKEESGIALTNFRTQSGQSWRKEHRDFNHIGLAFAIEEIPEDERALGSAASIIW